MNAITGFRLPLVALLLAGCVSSTTTTSMDEQPDEDRIQVSVMQAGRSRGCRAEFRVEAPLDTVARVLVTTQSSREARPMVAAARVVKRDSQSGLIILRFVPELGIPGDATYRYVTESPSEGEFRYRFKMVSRQASGPQGIDVRGGYTVTAEPDGGCRVVYEFTSSSAKLRRDQLLKLIKREASSIMNLSEKATR